MKELIKQALALGTIGVITLIIALGVALALNTALAAALIYGLNALNITDIAFTAKNLLAGGLIIMVVQAILGYKGE